MTDTRRDLLLELLPACDLPPELVSWLAHAFETQAGGGDLLQALELPGADLDRRDSLIQTVLALTPGGSFAARASFFLDCLSGQSEHPRHDMRRLIARLRLLAVPKSIKQLARIEQNRRCDGWRQREQRDMRGDLCPAPVTRFNRTMSNKLTGT